MKKRLRGVVVEYKGGRHARKMNKPNALWGNIDLKTMAEGMQEDISLPGNTAAFGINARDNAAVPTEEAAASQVPPAGSLPSPPASAPRILETVSTPSPVQLPEVLPATPAEPVVSATRPTIRNLEDTIKPSPTATPSDEQMSRRAERSAPKWKRKSAAPRPVSKAHTEQPATTALTPLVTTVSVNDEIDALEAANLALKLQLIKHLHHENTQLAEMLERVKQTAIV